MRRRRCDYTGQRRHNTGQLYRHRDRQQRFDCGYDSGHGNRELSGDRSREPLKNFPMGIPLALALVNQSENDVIRVMY